MENDVMVSILCETYNHEDYIADAIEGFLMQKTNFKYEILIHDDASTDETAEIVRQYELRNPDLIKVIYQEENQYSQGVNVAEINEGRAVGKYLAICEGDDYWTDPEKLQIQVDHMEENPGCSLCVHAGLHRHKGREEKFRSAGTSRSFSVEEIIDAGGDLFDTASFLRRRDLGDSRPDFYYKNPYAFSDYQLMIYAALVGDVYYIDRVMSVYRYDTPGSWTSRNMREIEETEKHYEEVNAMLAEVDRYTEGKYHRTIEETRRGNEFFILTLKKDFKQARSGRYREIYDSLDLKEKTVFFVKEHLPQLAETFYRIRGN